MRFFLILLSVLLCTPNHISAKAIHLFLASDANDKTIGNSAKRNCKNIEEVFSYVAEMCKVPFYVTKITSLEETLTSACLEQWLKKSHVARDDVVIFCYIGHGTRNKNTQLIWPCMAFDDALIDSSPIIEKVLKKRAALSLVLLDCCNRDPRYPLAPLPSAHEPTIESFQLERKNSPQIARNCRKLFFKRCGILIMSSASPQEYSWNWPDHKKNNEIISEGAFCMNSLLHNFIDELESPSPHWRSIFSRTKKLCYVESLNELKRWHKTPQTPQYTILIGSKKKEVRKYIHYMHSHCIYRRKGGNPKKLPRTKHFNKAMQKLVYFEMSIDKIKCPSNSCECK